MKVLLVAKPWRGGLAYYVYQALLKKFPNSVTWMQTYPVIWSDKLSYRKNRKRWRRELAERIEAHQHDLAIFINTVPDFNQLPYSKNRILWTTDDPRGVVSCLDPFAQVYISDPGYTSVFDVSGLQEKYAGVLSFAASTEVHYPVLTRDRNGTCFIANKDPNRDHYLADIITQKNDLTVYGNYFLRHKLFYANPLRFRPPFAFEKISHVYAKYKVSLNIHAQVVKAGTNMRSFEAAACKIPQLVEYRDGIEKLFTPDEEIVIFNNIDEYFQGLEKLKDNEFASRLAERAYQRVLAEHRYEHRLQYILDHLL